MRILFFLLAVTFVLSASGCETVKGIGKDLSNTGQNIKELVDRF